MPEKFDNSFVESLNKQQETLQQHNTKLLDLPRYNQFLSGILLAQIGVSFDKML